MTSHEHTPSSSVASGRLTRWTAILAVAALSGAATVYISLPLGQRLSAARAADPASAPVAATQPAKARKRDKKEEKERQHLDEAEAFFQAGTIPTIKIELAQEDKDKLAGNGREDVGADIHETIDGKTTDYLDVAIHIKGSAGSLRGIDDKPAVTLSFDKYKEKQEFHSLSKINLNNGAQDQTFMIENLGNALFRDAGYAGCRCTNAHVWINERDFGMYVLKEGFDGAYLKRFFPPPHGTLYEAAFLKDVNEELFERVNTNKREKALTKELLAAAREGDAAKRRERLAKVVDVDRFFTFMAMEALMAHWDGYCGNHNNYRLYHDPAAGKLIFLPHGMDQLFQQPEYPLVPTGAIVSQTFTASPEDRAKYMERVTELRERVVTLENINQHVDQIAALLAPGMKALGPDGARQHEENTKQVRNRVLERVKGIDRQLGAIPKPLMFDAQGYLALAADKWEDKPESGDVKIERVTEGGKAVIRFKAAGTAGASVRQPITLPQGKYTFEGQVKPTDVAITEGTPSSGVGLRISGGTRTASVNGTSDWTKTTFEIDVPDASRDVVLVVEFRVVAAGQAMFDLGSLKLKKH